MKTASYTRLLFNQFALGKIEDNPKEHGSVNFQAVKTADEMLGRIDPIDLNVVFEMSAREEGTPIHDEGERKEME